MTRRPPSSTRSATRFPYTTLFRTGQCPMLLTMPEAPMVLVEVEPFTARARLLWSEAELDVFKDFIARNPLAGSPIQGTGGVRKVRWAASGRGKRGGARVIYHFREDRKSTRLNSSH